VKDIVPSLARAGCGSDRAATPWPDEAIHRKASLRPVLSAHRASRGEESEVMMSHRETACKQ
jgi:hypothetical protein